MFSVVEITENRQQLKTNIVFDHKRDRQTLRVTDKRSTWRTIVIEMVIFRACTWVR